MPTSDLTNALVAEWEKISAARSQNLVESTEKWRLIKQHINAQGFGDVSYLLME